MNEPSGDERGGDVLAPKLVLGTAEPGEIRDPDRLRLSKEAFDSSSADARDDDVTLENGIAAGEPATDGSLGGVPKLRGELTGDSSCVGVMPCIESLATLSPCNCC